MFSTIRRHNRVIRGRRDGKSHISDTNGANCGRKEEKLIAVNLIATLPIVFD